MVFSLEPIKELQMSLKLEPKISAAFVTKLLHVIPKSKTMKLFIRKKNHSSAKFAIADLDENMTKTDMFRKVSNWQQFSRTFNRARKVVFWKNRLLGISYLETKKVNS